VTRVRETAAEQIIQPQRGSKGTEQTRTEGNSDTSQAGEGNGDIFSGPGGSLLSLFAPVENLPRSLLPWLSSVKNFSLNRQNTISTTPHFVRGREIAKSWACETSRPGPCLVARRISSARRE
jgi:hypothetical protein